MAGDPKPALTILQGIKNITALLGFHAVRARALLADGKPIASADEARRDTRENWPEPIEPFITRTIRRDDEEALGRALLVMGKRAQAASHLRAAAELGSAGAKDLLATLSTER